MNPKLIIAMGHTLMCLSIVGMILTESWKFYVFCASVGFPLGIGMVYWVPVMCAWEWFPERKGMVSGLIIGGYGFGAFIFGFISTAIANPDNFKPTVPEDGSTTDKLMPQSVGEAVPRMYTICLIIWFFLGLAAVFGVSRNPEFVRQEE
jgi:OFA family oxalate/formate antiporter-like MFS transporter